MNGAVITVTREGNGLVRKRKRRDHELDRLFSAGKITARQRDAGIMLHEAFCKTELTGEAAFTKVFVDVTPDYGADALRRAERSSEFGRLHHLVPPQFRPVVWHVAISNLALRSGFSRDGKDQQSHMAQLQVGLDVVANGSGRW